MKILRYITLLTLMVLLLACSKPVPADKSAYIGEWQSKEMYLLILADGTVYYERLKNGGKTSVNGPLQEFIGDDFSVGLSFLSTTFNVTEAPHLQDGRWVMVVDGVKLVKSEEEI